MIYNPHVWTHGEVITSQLLQSLENAVSSIAGGAYEKSQYNYTTNDPGTEDNKIATQETVTAAVNTAISSLSATKSVTADGRYTITQIDEANGVLNSISAVAIPIATTAATGLVKITDSGHISVDSNGSIAIDYILDGTYNSSTNKIATESTIKNAISNAASLAEVSDGNNGTYADECLAITNITGNSTTGSMTFERALISIPHTQVNDLIIDGNAETNGVNANKYIIPTSGTVTSAISTAINSITTTLSDTASAGTTITNLSYSNGTLSATISSISITKSQISDLAVVSSTTAGLMSASDKEKLDGIAEMTAAPASGTDTRAAAGLIAREDKDTLDTNNTLIGNNFIFNDSGYLVGIRIYENTSSPTEYKVLSIDGLSEPITIEEE